MYLSQRSREEPLDLREDARSPARQSQAVGREKSPLEGAQTASRVMSPIQAPRTSQVSTAKRLLLLLVLVVVCF